MKRKRYPINQIQKIKISGRFGLQNPDRVHHWCTAEMSTDRTVSDWIRTEANFIRIEPSASFLKIGGSGLDRTQKIFVVLM